MHKITLMRLKMSIVLGRIIVRSLWKILIVLHIIVIILKLGRMGHHILICFLTFIRITIIIRLTIFLDEKKLSSILRALGCGLLLLRLSQFLCLLEKFIVIYIIICKVKNLLLLNSVSILPIFIILILIIKISIFFFQINII